MGLRSDLCIITVPSPPYLCTSMSSKSFFDIKLPSGFRRNQDASNDAEAGIPQESSQHVTPREPQGQQQRQRKKSSYSMLRIPMLLLLGYASEWRREGKLNAERTLPSFKLTSSDTRRTWTGIDSTMSWNSRSKILSLWCVPSKVFFELHNISS